MHVKSTRVLLTARALGEPGPFVTPVVVDWARRRVFSTQLKPLPLVDWTTVSLARKFGLVLRLVALIAKVNGLLGATAMSRAAPVSCIACSQLMIRSVTSTTHCNLVSATPTSRARFLPLNLLAPLWDQNRSRTTALVHGACGVLAMPLAALAGASVRLS